METIQSISSPRINSNPIESEYNEKGAAAILNFLPPDVVQSCYLLFEQYCTAVPTQHIWFSNANEPFPKAMELSDKLKALLQPFLETYFSDYKVEMFTMLCKFPQSDSFLHLHRDYTNADESRFEYRNVWIPLVDLDDVNGMLFFVPRSHKVFTEPRYLGIPPVFGDEFNLYQPYLDYFKGKAGDALLYSDKCLHGSFYNKGNKARPVIHFGLLHRNVQLLDIQPIGNKRYRKYRSELAKLIEQDFSKKNYSPEDFIEEFEYSKQPLNTAEKLTLLKKCKFG